MINITCTNKVYCSLKVSLNSSDTIAFNFGLIPFGKVWTPFYRAQLAGAVEYTDCIFAEGEDSEQVTQIGH